MSYDDDTPPDNDYYPPEPEASRSRDGRTPPQDLHAEQAVIGAMLINTDAISAAVEVLRPEDFYRPSHETIHHAILDLFGRGEPVDMITVGDLLLRQGELAAIGGATYLHTLASMVPVAANAAHYAQIVADKATLRRLVDAAARVSQWAYAAEADVTEIVDRSQAEMFAAVPRTAAEDYQHVADFMDATIDLIEAASFDGGDADGVRTGFYDLDDLLGGLRAGQMITVAGRPGMGKSTMAMDVLRAASIRQGLPSCLFTLEMTRHEVAMRLLSAEAKVPLQNIRTGHLGEDDWSRIALAMPTVGAAPLFVDDSPNLTMTEIRAKARRLKQTHGLSIMAVDYMQLMTSGKRVESRQLEVSEFSRAIKLLAKELEIPVLALSQLNRGPEQRTNKRPMMSDLRESGSIEQDSDIVILLHREDAYEVESTRPGEADFIVAKHRNGATKDIAVAAQLHYSRFTDLARG